MAATVRRTTPGEAPAGARGSRADLAYAHLRGLIEDQGVRPGDALGEVRLADWIGVSRTPVRQALQRLEGEGLVRRTPRGGFAVATLTVREVEEVGGLLELLDGRLIRAAARRLTPRDADLLLECARALTDAATTGDIATWDAADRRFHRIVHGAADNRLEADLAEGLRRRLHRFWINSASRQGRLRDCSQEHADLARALADGDTAVLDVLVAHHAAHMRAGLLQMLDQAAPFVRGDGAPPGRAPAALDGTGAGR